jgi:hypothetical protein
MKNGLILNDVTISIQNFGTRLAVFLQGEREAVEQRYFSLWNHQATGGELEWWSDNCAFIWIWDSPATKKKPAITAYEKLGEAMSRGALAELLNHSNKKLKGQNGMEMAREITFQRLEQIAWVHWIKQEAWLDLHDFGTSVSAEKGTGNFDDDVVGKGLERTGTNLDARKLLRDEKEPEAETAEA